MKLKHIFLGCFILTQQLKSFGQKPVNNVPQELQRPSLVVGIVVDQMRWDYLYRFYNNYGQIGFRRMLNEGFTCENTNIDYIPTVTAAGHASVYTGSVPAIHGIAGNDFVIRATGKTMYCTADSLEQTVGAAGAAGEMSPRNLLTSTITDELKLATNFRSKVVGIALKDRGAILPAGHTADAAYWFDDQSQNWISSTYYMKELPGWVNKFNALKLSEKYLSRDWKLLYKPKAYVQSAKDDSPHEAAFKGMNNPVFPVPTSVLARDIKGLIRSTPHGNSFTLDFAREAVIREKLGNNEVTDFLTISLSSTDYMGHQFGPNSMEIEDTYLRLDNDLGTFFSFLDGQVGEGNYTIFLTADHAAANNAGFLKERGIPAGFWNVDQAKNELNALLEKNFGVENLVLGFHNFQLNLDLPKLKKARLSEEAIKNESITYLSDLEGVSIVLDMMKSQTEILPTGLKEKIANGFSRERSGVVQVVLKPGWYFGTAKTGTTHGTWYPYDTHIPLLFMGWGVKQGQLLRNTNMTDIAATIAVILHIQVPNGSVGKPITELVAVESMGKVK
jgi:predicted AlkP superfamily pyrophosphatase or phosphodiesterase